MDRRKTDGFGAPRCDLFDRFRASSSGPSPTLHLLSPLELGQVMVFDVGWLFSQVVHHFTGPCLTQGTVTSRHCNQDLSVSLLGQKLSHPQLIHKRRLPPHPRSPSVLGLPALVGNSGRVEDAQIHPTRLTRPLRRPERQRLRGRRDEKDKHLIINSRPVLSNAERWTVKGGLWGMKGSKNPGGSFWGKRTS